MNDVANNRKNAATPVSGSDYQAHGIQETEPELPPPPAPVSPRHSSAAGNEVRYDQGQDRRRLAAGTELSEKRYVIEHLAAAGGMGAVYLATDRRFNKPCAVKEMLDDFRSESERTQAVEWFSREASLLLELNHQCIPRVRDFFVDSGRHYLVMDFIKGRTMGEAADHDTAFTGANGIHGVSESRARYWGQQLCSVLSYLHNQTPPIIFRDLKPSNIMVTDNDIIKLIDFGIARPFQSQGQATVIMTHGYAPQEQVLGSPEPRSDLYALGATLFRVLTHHDPSNNKPNVFTFPPVRSLRPDISPAFEQVIMKSLALFPQQRWTNAAEMERAIVTLPPVSQSSPAPVVAPPQLAPTQVINPNTPQRPLSGPNAGTPTPTPPNQANANVTRAISPAPGMNGPAGQLIQVAHSQLAANQLDAAYATVQRAYAVEPNNALVHKLFGQVFARRQQAELAQKAYLRSIQLNGDDAETHKLFGDVWFFLRKLPHSAIPAYTQSLHLNPKDYEAHQRLASCYEQTNQLELALREYQEAARLAPKQNAASLYYSLGQVAMRLGQFAVAEHAFVQVLMINPGDHHTRFLLSQAYENQGKLEDAFRECGYVTGPLGASTPAVLVMYQRLRTRLRR
jgi:serine/threonine protein kinase